MTRKVVVVPYDSNWPALFDKEVIDLAAVLGREVVAIHHIGSTAIIGTAAKPIIDILLEIHDINKMDNYDDEMIKLGYQPKGEFGIPRRRFFTKSDGATRTHHLHIFQARDPEVARHLNFVEYMAAHPKEVQAYSRLKEELAGRFLEDIDGYTQAKDSFIKKIDAKASAWRKDSRRPA